MDLCQDCCPRPFFDSPPTHYNPAVMKNTSRSQSIRAWIGILISLLCLAAIFLFINPAQIWQALLTADYGYLLLSGVAFIVFMLLRAVRWRFMLARQVSYGQVFHIQNIGYMLTNLLPLRIGDVARAVLIGGVPPVTIPQGVSTMVVERVLDLLFMVTLLPLTLSQVGTVSAEVRAIGLSAGILAITATFILILAANQRRRVTRLTDAILLRIPFLRADTWNRRIDDLLIGLNSLSRWRDALILLSLSILVWLPVIFAYYCGLLAVHLQPTWAMAGFVVCAAALSIAAPSSPGQVGVYHAGVIAALTQVLVQPEAQSASFAFLYHAMTFVLNVLLGIIGLRFVGATLDNVVHMTRRLRNKRV